MTTDPFDPALTHRRTVKWQDAAATRAAAHGRTGLEIMRGIRDGTLPSPPIARLMDFHVDVAEPGQIVMGLEPHEALENPAGLIHGAVAAALLDTAMGACVHTLLPADKISVTLDLKITYLRPLTTASGRLTASGKVLNLGGRNAYVEGELRNGAGELAAHAVGNFSIISARS